jgi:hypothetical protein
MAKRAKKSYQYLPHGLHTWPTLCNAPSLPDFLGLPTLPDGIRFASVLSDKNSANYNNFSYLEYFYLD